MLLHPDRDARLAALEDDEGNLPPEVATLREDLGLADVIAAMAVGDAAVATVAERVLLAPTPRPATISYRQAVLADALAHPRLVRELVRLSAVGLGHEQHVYRGLITRPTSVVARAVDVLDGTVEVLTELRALADQHREVVTSDGLRGLLERLQGELCDDRLAAMRDVTARLRFPEGVVVAAELGAGGRTAGHTLREPPLRSGVLRRLRPGLRSASTIRLSPEDDAGARALAELREVLVEDVAAALEQASEDVLAFLRQLNAEAAFYLGAIELHERLQTAGAPVCVPVLTPYVTGAAPQLIARGLVDAGLLVRTGQPAVGNDVLADGQPMVLVTGANQGGKSTFLRSVGLAQLLAHAGLFVTAEHFTSTWAGRVYSHVERDEDPTLTHGRLDAELAEMSAIVDRLHPGDLLLLNESFGSTNEREGSLLAGEIVLALLDAGVRIVEVTHLTDLAMHLHRDHGDRVLVLRAERRDDGSRTFRLRPGAPEATAYGADLAREVLGEDVSGS